MKFFLLLLVLLASNVNNLKILHNKNNTNEWLNIEFDLLY